MCTAISFKSGDHYFGRTLDYEKYFGQTVVITPRKYVLEFRKLPPLKQHYAMIGMALVQEKYPLYFDATNEKGLSAAGLNFPGNAVYYPLQKNKDNVAPFEFILWILGQCSSVSRARDLLSKMSILNVSFSDDLPLTPLHWMISDRNESIVVESTEKGLHVYDNPVGVLTNNPIFEIQLFNLNNFIHLSKKEPENEFSEKITLNAYSRGMGALGLPGDLSSSSRFVRASFVKLNSVCNKEELSGVSQFFHILGSVVQQRGCAMVENEYEITQYISCCNTDRGIYYYKTYDNSRITAIRLNPKQLEDEKLHVFTLREKCDIYYENVE